MDKDAVAAALTSQSTQNGGAMSAIGSLVGDKCVWELVRKKERSFIQVQPLLPGWLRVAGTWYELPNLYLSNTSYRGLAWEPSSCVEAPRSD